jgi:hypothetical protein
MPQIPVFAISHFLIAFNAATLAFGASCCLLVEAQHEMLAHRLFEPAFSICRAVTPASWQTMGNVLLGFTWIAAASMMYGAFIALVVLTGSYLSRRKRKGKRAAADSK